MIYLFRKTVYNCHQATLLSIKREEGAISLFERMKLAYHLMYCDPCRRFIAQSQQLTNAGNELSKSLSAKPPFSLSDVARERIQKTVGQV
jgi:hypothetical protein